MISNDKVSKDITRVQFYITYLAGQEIATITITDIIKRIKFAKNMKISHNMKPKMWQIIIKIDQTFPKSNTPICWELRINNEIWNCPSDQI